MKFPIPKNLNAFVKKYNDKIFLSRYDIHNVSLDNDMVEKAITLLDAVIEIINKLNIKYWLEGGTCLGAYRDNKMIPWDHDLDLGIQFSSNADIHNLIKILKTKYRLKIKGFPIEDKIWKLGDYRLIKVYPKKNFISYEKLCLDIFIFYKEKLSKDNAQLVYKYVCFNKNGYHPKKYLDTLQSISFYSKIYKIPNYTEEWLESKYGEDWETPKKEWHVLIDDGTIIR